MKFYNLKQKAMIEIDDSNCKLSAYQPSPYKEAKYCAKAKDDDGSSLISFIDEDTYYKLGGDPLPSIAEKIKAREEEIKKIKEKREKYIHFEDFPVIKKRLQAFRRESILVSLLASIFYLVMFFSIVYNYKSILDYLSIHKIELVLLVIFLLFWIRSECKILCYGYRIILGLPILAFFLYSVFILCDSLLIFLSVLIISWIIFAIWDYLATYQPPPKYKVFCSGPIGTIRIKYLFKNLLLTFIRAKVEFLKKIQENFIQKDKFQKEEVATEELIDECSEKIEKLDKALIGAKMTHSGELDKRVKSNASFLDIYNEKQDCIEELSFYKNKLDSITHNNHIEEEFPLYIYFFYKSAVTSYFYLTFGFFIYLQAGGNKFLLLSFPFLHLILRSSLYKLYRYRMKKILDTITDLL